MKKIAIINFYFAKTVPSYMDFYLSSFSYNPTVDLYLFTNLELDCTYSNVHIIKTTFEKFADQIKTTVEAELKKMGIQDRVVISHPYKIADFRPAFGLCFQEYICEYDFWGGCDLDLIFGNIRKYIPDETLDNYDKIYEHGHFFLIRNTEECNKAFLEDYEKSFAGVLHLEKNSFFEEVYEKPWLPHGGINPIFDKRGRLYKNRKAFCDISFKYTNLIDLKNDSGSCQNVFKFVQGNLYRLSLINDEIRCEECFYAHFQKRQVPVHTDCLDCFYVTNVGFEQYAEDSMKIFEHTDKKKKITYKYIKFRYLDSIRRKINGDFKWSK